MPIEFGLLAAAALALTAFLWQPLLVPRCSVGDAPLGLSWCADGAGAGVQLVLPLLRLRRRLWCLRATAAVRRRALHVGLQLHERPAR